MHSCNYFSALANNDEDNDDEISLHDNRALYADTALSDSGATSHFIIDGTHVIDKQIAKNPIK